MCGEVHMAELSKSILYQEDIQKITPNLQAVKFLSQEIAEKTQSILFQKEQNKLSLLTTNNFPTELQELKMKLEAKGYILDIFYTTTDGFRTALVWYQKIKEQEQQQQSEIKKMQTAEGKSAIGMIQELLPKKWWMDAGEFILEFVRLSFQAWASDLHFQSEDTKIVARMRIDGVLQKIVDFSSQEFEKYLQKLKFISGVKMNITKVPQDGRFSFQASSSIWEKRKIDARVNFMPWIDFESIVIRFLDSGKGIRSLEDAGINGKNYEIMKKYLTIAWWLIIFTGPTGSGKTTSLYSILNYMNTGKEKIITLEDPVEYQLPWAQQSQIDTNAWYTFEDGLHAILRHDPDIILVWETRSKETAETCINAALTGHKVFTTLHTDSAITAISRLMNMGVKPYMLGPALKIVVSQRLVRKVCPHCKQKRPSTYWEKQHIQETVQKIRNVSPNFAADLNFDWELMLVSGHGCEKCNNTWYLWRLSVIEVFEITEPIKKIILEWWTITEVYAQARADWYLTMEEDGIMKVLQWLTTMDEIRRIL